MALTASSSAHAQVAGINGSGCIYNTIQDALDNAAVNDDVWVLASPTPYSESLTVSQGVRVHAAAAGCLVPVTTGQTAIVSSSSPLTVSTSNASVKFFDFTFQNGGGSNIHSTDTNLFLYDSYVLFSTGRGIWGTGGSLRLEDTTVMLNEATGIYWDAGNMYIVDSNITRNTANSTGGGLALWNGVDLVVAGSTTIHDNEVDDLFGVALGGGCIHAVDSIVDLRDDTLVEDCDSPDGPGGAIAATRSVITVRDDAIVRDSMSKFDGGLIALEDGELWLLDNAQLTGGYSQGYGGLIHAHKGAEVRTGPSASVELSGGRADFGGGISALGADFDNERLIHLGEGTRVISNSARFDGGGVYLDGGIYEQMGEGAWIGDNGNTPNSAKRGGGIFATNFADLQIGDPNDQSTWIVLDPFGEPDLSVEGSQVRFNTATQEGGGIYLDNDAVLTMDGAAVFTNRAVGPVGVGNGGGIFARDGGQATLNASIISSNRARVAGGGVHLDAAELFMDVQGVGDQLRCLVGIQPDTYCSEMRDNEAGRPADGTTGLGGAIYATGTPFEPGRAVLAHTALLGNRAQVNGAHIFIEPRGRVVSENNLVADATVNANWPVDRGVINNGRFDAAYTTFGGSGTTIIYAIGASGGFNQNIVWPDGTPGTGVNYTSLGGPYGGAACNVGLLPTGPAVDPLFTTTARGYYRLASASPAIDACGGYGPSTDLDTCPRPWPGSAVLDAGGLEYSAGGCP